MSTEPNPKYANGGTPSIALAGKQWPIPPLAIKQNRIIVPALMKMLPHFSAVMGSDDETDTSPEAMVARQRRMAAVLMALDEDMFDLLIKVVHAALTRAHPDMSKDEFLDMDIGVREMFDALNTITQQCGMFVKKEDATPGEAMARPSHQTGTA